MNKNMGIQKFKMSPSERCQFSLTAFGLKIEVFWDLDSEIISLKARLQRILLFAFQQ